MSKYSEKKQRRRECLALGEAGASFRPPTPPAAGPSERPAAPAAPDRASAPPAGESAAPRETAPSRQVPPWRPHAGRSSSLSAAWRHGYKEPPSETADGAAVKKAVQSSRTAAAGIGGFGPCGRPICCAGWLKNAEELKVSIRMAKAQTVSLSPESINGYCCQMKCCLAFEYGQEGCAKCPTAKKAATGPEAPPGKGPSAPSDESSQGDEKR